MLVMNLLSGLKVVRGRSELGLKDVILEHALFTLFTVIVISEQSCDALPYPHPIDPRLLNSLTGFEEINYPQCALLSVIIMKHTGEVLHISR